LEGNFHNEFGVPYIGHEKVKNPKVKKRGEEFKKPFT